MLNAMPGLAAPVEVRTTGACPPAQFMKIRFGLVGSYQVRTVQFPRNEESVELQPPKSGQSVSHPLAREFTCTHSLSCSFAGQDLISPSAIATCALPRLD